MYSNLPNIGQLKKRVNMKIAKAILARLGCYMHVQYPPERKIEARRRSYNVEVVKKSKDVLGVTKVATCLILVGGRLSSLRETEFAILRPVAST